MNHNRDLIKFIEEVVELNATRHSDHWSLEWDDMLIADQNKLTALYIEDDGRELLLISENQNDLATVLVNYYNTSSTFYLTEFAEKLTDYYKHRLIKLIDEMCKTKFSERMEEAGYKSTTHGDNGEVFWIKR